MGLVAGDQQESRQGHEEEGWGFFHKGGVIAFERGRCRVFPALKRWVILTTSLRDGGHTWDAKSMLAGVSVSSTKSV